MKSRPAHGRAACLVVAAATLLLPLAVNAHAQTAEGEMLRFLRQAEAYFEHNSNNNVFRSSRHFHPSRNALRSSRHYRQRLAASNESYPVRSFGRYTETINGEQFVRSWDHAHPRGDRYTVRPEQSGPGHGLGPRGTSETSLPIAIDPVRAPEGRTTVEAFAAHRAERRRPTQQAVMERVVNADGSISTLIRSVPIASVADGAEPLAEPATASGDAGGAPEPKDSTVAGAADASPVKRTSDWGSRLRSASK